MALIKCPECKRVISDTVTTCPHCGYSISQYEKEIALEGAKTSPVEMEPDNNTIIVENQTYKSKDDGGTFGGGVALGILLGLIGLIIAACVGKKETRSGALLGFLTQAGIGVTLWLISACSYYRLF